jgi:PAS domain S-box-containing protein
MSGLAIAAILIGVLTLAGLWLWLSLKRNMPQDLSELSSGLYVSNGTENAAAMIVATPYGQVVHINDRARVWLDIQQETPDLAQIERLVQPRDNFLNLFAGETHTSFQFHNRWVEASSHYVPGADDARMVIVMRELSGATPSDEGVMSVSQAMNVIAEIGEVVDASMGMEQNLQSILNIINRVLPSDAGEISLWDEAQNYLWLRGWIGADPSYALAISEAGGGYKVGQGVAGWVAQHRQPLLVTDDLNLSIQNLLANHAYHGIVAVPLLTNGDLVGTLTLLSHKHNHYDQGAVALLQAISPAVVTAIRNAELYARQEDRIKDIASLQQIAEHPKSDKDATPIYRLLNERMAKLVDAEMCGVFLYDQERNALLPQLPFYGVPDNFAALFMIPLTEGSLQQDIWLRQPHWVSDDVMDDPLMTSLGLGEIIKTVGIRNTVMFPLQIAGERIGMVAISNKRRKTGFTPNDMQSLRVLSTQAALVVENIRLYQRERMIDTELIGLQEMTHAIGALSHEGEFYAEITERIARLTGSAMCGILSYDSKNRRLVAQVPFYGIAAALVADYEIALTPGSVTDELWTEVEFWYSNRVATDPLVYYTGLDALAEKTGVQKTLFAAMSAGGRRIGVVQVSNKTDGSDYNDKDARLLQIFATQAAAIIENARLYREVRLRAEQAESLRRVAEMASSVLTTDQTFQPVLEVIAKFMDSSAVFINILDHTTNSLVSRPRWVYGLDLTEPLIQDLSLGGYEATPALAKRAFFSNDVPQDKRILKGYQNIAQRFGVKNTVLVPLLIGDRSMGELGVANRKGRQYTREDVNALSAVAAQIAAAVERLLTYEATGENLRSRMEELDAIARVSNQLALTMDLNEVLKQIQYEALKATRADDSTIVLLRAPETGSAPNMPLMERRIGGADPMQFELAPIEREAVLRGTEPVLVADYLDSDLKPMPSFARSAAAATIIYTNRVIGVIHVYHHQPRHFGDRSTGFLVTLSAKASLGYQNADFYRQQTERGQRLSQRVDQLNRIFELGQMLQTNTDTPAIMEATAYSVQQSVGFDTVLMLLTDEKDGVLRRIAHAGMPLDVFANTKGDTLLLDVLEKLMLPDYRNNESYFFPIEDVERWYIPGIQALSTAYVGNRSVLATSKADWHEGDMLLVRMMGRGGNLLGLMVLDRPYSNRRPDRQTMEVLEIFAHQAANMLENTRLFSESQRNAAQEARLNEMINAIASTQDLSEIASIIAHELHSLLPLHRLTLVLAGSDESQSFDYLKVSVLEAGNIQVTREQRRTLERTALGRTFDDQKEFLYLADDEAVRHYDDLKAWYARGEVSSLLLPLVAGGECLGALHIGSHTPALAEPETRQFVNRLGQLVSSTVQTARLFNQAVNLRVLNESVVESIQQGIVVLDSSGRIFSVNQYMRQKYAWDDNALSQDLFAYRPEMSEFIKDDLRAVLEWGEPRERIGQTSTGADGALLVRNFYLYPLRSNNQVRGAVLLVEDVTDRTRLEEAIEARANQLAALTEVSTRITASLERSEVLALALDEMGWIISFEVMAIFRRNGSFMVLEGITGMKTEAPGMRVRIADDTRVQQLVEAQRVITLQSETPMTFVADMKSTAPLHSWMGVPLVNQGHVVGMLVLAQFDSDAYQTRQEQDVAFTFASQVAIALANADLFEQTFERTNELGTLLEAAQATSLTRDVNEVFRTVAELMFSALDTEYCSIMIWDEVDNELVVEFAISRSGSTDNVDPPGIRYGLIDYPARQRALQQREVVVIVDTERLKLDEPVAYMSEVLELRDAGRAARMLVPLVVRDQAIGMIQLEQTAGDDQAVTQQKVRLARALGTQVAIAIENARLSTETSKRFEELLTINALSQAISSTLNLDDMLPVIKEQVPLITGAEELYLALYDELSRVITFPLAVRQGGAEFLIAPRPLGTDEVSYIIRRKHSLSLGADYFSPDELRRSMGITSGEGDAKSYMGVPVKSGDQVVGVLAVRNLNRTRAFTLNDDRILSTVGSQLGAAIQNARLFERVSNFAAEAQRLVAERTEELEEERDRLDTLYQITSELSRTLDMENLLDRALSMVSKAVGATDGVILLSDPATDNLYCRAWIDPKRLYYPQGPMGPARHPAEGLATWLIQNDDLNEHVVVVEDLHEEMYWNKSRAGAEDLRSALAVVLESNEDPMGVMVLLSNEPYAFTENHLKLLVPAANQVAASINSADLYQLIRDQAERLGKLLRTEQEESQKNSAILESINDGVMLADSSGKIILFNAAAERILQMPRDQVIGQSVNSLAGVYGAAAVRWLQMMEEWTGSQERPDITDTSYTTQRLELGDIIVSTQLSPVYIGDSFLGTVSVFRDITRDVEADRAKDAFIENVSHEFRTPLTPIKGYIDLLLMGAGGDLSDVQSNFLGTIKNNVDRLTILVNDVLNISKLSRRVLSMQRVDLQEVIPAVVEHIAARPANANRDMDVRVYVEPGLPRIRADREKLMQIINNLVDNAFNYTLPGGKIDVSATMENNGKFVLVKIEDTGVGIPDDFQEKAWRRFERHQDTALKLEVAGTGLGLPLVKELVQMHNGEVWLESVVDVGTTFYIRLPLEQPNYITETMTALPMSTEIMPGD